MSRTRKPETLEQKIKRNLRDKAKRAKARRIKAATAVKTKQQKTRRKKDKQRTEPLRRATPQKYRVEPDMTEQGTGKGLDDDLLQFGALSKALLVVTDYYRIASPTISQELMYQRALLTMKHCEQAYQMQAAMHLDRCHSMGLRDSYEVDEIDKEDMNIGF